MFIAIDLNTVPDKPIMIPSGIYNFRIMSVEEKAPQNVNTKGVNIVLKLEVVSHPEQEGRQMTYYVFIAHDSKREDNYTGIKRVFLSAGVSISSAGMNTNELVGKVITASVVAGIFVDKTTKIQRESANIGTVFIPADNVKPGDLPPDHAVTSVVSAADVSAVLGGSAPTAVTQPAPVAAPQPQAMVADILGQTAKA